MYIVTGGGSGIGRALAWSLAHRNQSVLVVGRREPQLKETAEQSPLITYHQADLSTQDGWDSLKQRCQSFSEIKALVNNAGLIEPIALLKEVQLDAWNHLLNTNLNAVLFLTQMLQSKLAGGRVLNISSGAAHFPIKGWGPYCVSKAALSMLTRCWQEESDSIAYASVMPGIIDTAMQAIARSNLNVDKERAGFYNQLKVKNLLISPETVAAFLTWLLLDIEPQVFSAQEWDIYDKSHHKSWLKAPHVVPQWQ